MVAVFGSAGIIAALNLACAHAAAADVALGLADGVTVVTIEHARSTQPTIGMKRRITQTV